jgi:tight adherence protein B
MMLVAILLLAIMLVLVPLAETIAVQARLRRRAGAVVSVQAHRRAGTGRPSGAPILRAGGRASDLMLQHWLPGGGQLARGLATGGGRQSLALVCGLGLAVAGGAAMLGSLLGLPMVLAALLAPLLGLGVVHMVVAAQVRRVRRRFAGGFPDALAVMIRSLRASLPVTAAIGEVARGAGPVARAFAAIALDMKLGQPLETALWTTARGIGVAEFDFFVVTLTLQRETGGNLAVTLEGLDDTLRMRRQLALKIRAMAAEARASAMIIGSLPFAMGGLLWATSPDYLVLLFTTPLGHAMLGAGLASIGVGAIVIGQMMQIKA